MPLQYFNYSAYLNQLIEFIGIVLVNPSEDGPSLTNRHFKYFCNALLARFLSTY